MRYYSGPIIALLVLLLIAAEASSFTDKRRRQTQERLANAVDQHADSLHSLEARRADRIRAEAGSDAVNKFLAEWSLLSPEGANPGQVGLVLSDLAQRLSLAGNRMPTPTLNDYHFGNGFAEVQTVNYSVQGDYHQALDWLGQVEDRYPYARVGNLDIKGSGGNEVELVVCLEFLLDENGGAK